MVAGLAGKTSLMKSSTVLAIGLIFAKRFKDLDSDYVDRLIELLLILVKEKNKETYRSILAFFKFYSRAVDVTTLKKQLKNILTALFEWDSDSQEATRAVLKTVLKTVFQRVGLKELMENTPKDHLKLIRNIDKTERYEKNVKKREEAKKTKKIGPEKRKVADFMDIQLPDNEDLSDVEEQENDGMVAEAKQGDNNLLLKFDSASEKFHFTKHHLFEIKQKNAKQEQKKEEDKSRRQDVYYDKVLEKLIIKEAPVASVSGKRKRDKLDEVLGDNVYVEGGEEGMRTTKRYIHKPEDGQTYAGKVLSRFQKRRQNNSVHHIRNSGIEYQGRGGAKGDMNIPGRPDPFAFMQLNPLGLK